MTRQMAEIIYTASYVIAGLIALFVPLIVVFWLLGHWSDEEASGGVITACFLTIIIWAAGRWVLNGSHDPED